MISFVGAGPGAADLVTLRGAARLAAADVVVWASSLVPAELLDHCHPGVTVHDSATMTLEDVLEVFAAHGDDVPIVRLHSGDPSLYGAIQEQIDWCVARQRSWEIVPGVSSVAAASAALGRELTVPGISQSVVATRLAGRTASSMPAGEGVAAYATHGGTLAVLLSAARPDELQAELLAPGSAFTPDTPAAIVVRVTWPDQQVVRTTVGQLAEALRSTGATMTTLVMVGEALAPSVAARRSHLYAPTYTTAYRLRSHAGTTAGRPSARRTDAAAAAPAVSPAGGTATADRLPQAPATERPAGQHPATEPRTDHRPPTARPADHRPPTERPADHRRPTARRTDGVPTERQTSQPPATPATERPTEPPATERQTDHRRPTARRTDGVPTERQTSQPPATPATERPTEPPATEPPTDHRRPTTRRTDGRTAR